jgi:hypothetical protein
VQTQFLKHIIDEVTIVFLESGFTAVKKQLSFGVIWEGFLWKQEYVTYLNAHQWTPHLHLHLHLYSLHLD